MSRDRRRPQPGRCPKSRSRHDDLLRTRPGWVAGVLRGRGSAVGRVRGGRCGVRAADGLCSHRAAPSGSYTLSLHDALPISYNAYILWKNGVLVSINSDSDERMRRLNLDRKSTRLNSSHSQTSYAVFCLKNKNSPTCPATAVVHNQGAAPSPAPATMTCSVPDLGGLREC